MKTRYLILVLILGGFFLIIFGASIIQAPEAIAVSSAAPDFSTNNATADYTMSTLYFDDFSNPASGWLTGTGQHITLSYQSNEYEIEIFESWWWGASAPPLGDISIYSVESEARLHTGSEGMYGVIFDRLNWENYYVFIVLPNSRAYAVLRYDDANWIDIIPITSSTAINFGSAVNQLKVERAGDKIAVYANNQLLATTNDNTFTGTFSEVGLFAQTLNEEPIEARFDNFVVKQIPGYTHTYLPILFKSGASVLSPNTALPNELTGQGAGWLMPER